MARTMKMTDRKNYQFRVQRSHSGEYKGAESTNKSKYLAIKWDIDHGIHITQDKRIFMEEYERINNIPQTIIVETKRKNQDYEFY